MKLLRLRSNENELIYNGLINDNLILNKNSKIALQSVSWEKDTKVITITPDNSQITLNISGAQTASTDLVATLTEGLSYNAKNNLDELLTDIKRALINSFNIDVPKCVGLQVEITERSNNTVRINFDQSKIIDFFVELNTKNNNSVNVNVDERAGNIYFKSNNSHTFDAAIYRNTYGMIDPDEGCGIFRCQINKLDGAGHTGFYIGLSTINPDTMGGDFNFAINKLAFGIEARNSTVDYKIIRRNDATGAILLTDSNEFPNSFADNDDDNDFLEISCNRGKIEGAIYRHNGVTFVRNVLFSEDYTLRQSGLYPIIAFAEPNTGGGAGNNVEIKKVRFTDIFRKDDIQTELNDINIEHLNIPVPSQDLQFCDFTLTLNEELANFLGMRIVETIKDVELVANFRGINPVEFFDNSETYLVLSETLALDSYDYSDRKQKRRNILQVINNIREKSERDVLYNTNNPIFIDINNADRITLNNLRLRILDSDESIVNINGISEMTLLIKDEDE